MNTTDDQYKYEQKKINHIFHYTSNFIDLQKIVRQGFLPSYCKEEIGNKKYLTPMVSFCNIPIAEVDKYMRYGKNGIGMSLTWAVKKGLSPVIYTHENSPYQSILGQLSMLKLQFDLIEEDKNIGLRNYNIKDDSSDILFELDKENLTYKINLKILQFLKNWKTEYQGDKIITYQEREWRYVPDDVKIYPLIEERDLIYHDFLDKQIKPKPHLPNFPLEIDSLDDIKYIVVTTDKQREKIIGTLNNRFGEKATTKALLTGRLSILTASQIRNDF